MKSTAPTHRRAFAGAAITAIAFAALSFNRPADAQGRPPDVAEPGNRMRWFADAGVGDDTTSGSVGAMRDWATQWQLGQHAVTGYNEAAFSDWQVSRGARGDRSSFYRLGLTPVVRVWGSSERRGWFAEAGIGANLIGPSYRTANRRFSTVFNFGDHVGLGWRSAGASPWDVSLRAAHYSNGGIKKPNPGNNFLQLRFASTF